MANMQSEVYEALRSLNVEDRLAFNAAIALSKRDEAIDDLKEEIASTRADLKAEIAGVRSDLKAEIAGVRSDLKAEITGLRSDLKAEIAGVRSDLKVSMATAKTESAVVRALLAVVITLQGALFVRLLIT